MPEWTWEPDDFAALWYSDAYDRFPSPLRYTSRFAFNDDARAHRLAVRAGYTREELAGIQVALDTLGASELRIEILGATSAHKRSTGPGDMRKYRIVGARTEAHAVTFSQAGTDTEHGPIHVRLFRPETLAARLVSALPVCVPGTAEPATFHPEDLDRAATTISKTGGGPGRVNNTVGCSAGRPTAAVALSCSPGVSTRPPNRAGCWSGTTSPVTAAIPNSAAPM